MCLCSVENGATSSNMWWYEKSWISCFQFFSPLSTIVVIMSCSSQMLQKRSKREWNGAAHLTTAACMWRKLHLIAICFLFICKIHLANMCMRMSYMRMHAYFWIFMRLNSSHSCIIIFSWRCTRESNQKTSHTRWIRKCWIRSEAVRTLVLVRMEQKMCVHMHIYESIRQCCENVGFGKFCHPCQHRFRRWTIYTDLGDSFMGFVPQDIFPDASYSFLSCCNLFWKMKLTIPCLCTWGCITL